MHFDNIVLFASIAAAVTKITDGPVNQPAKTSRKTFFQYILFWNTLEKHFFNIFQLQNIAKYAFSTYFKAGEPRKTVFLHTLHSNILEKHFFNIFRLRNVMKNTFSTLFKAGEPRKTLFRDVSRWNSPGEHFYVLVKNKNTWWDRFWHTAYADFHNHIALSKVKVNKL